MRAPYPCGGGGRAVAIAAKNGERGGGGGDVVLKERDSEVGCKRPVCVVEEDGRQGHIAGDGSW